MVLSSESIVALIIFGGHRFVSTPANILSGSLSSIVGRSIGTPPSAVRNVTNGEFDSVMRINVRGTSHYIRAQLNHTRSGENGRRGGSIVNAASIAGTMGFTDNATYVASKHAVIGISKCATKEVGQEVSESIALRRE